MTSQPKIITNKGTEYLISEEDNDLLQYHWTDTKNEHPVARIKGKQNHLSHIIFERIHGFCKQHCRFLNKDRKDCRRENLKRPERSATVKKIQKKWAVCGNNQGQYVYLGYFESREEAYRAREAYITHEVINPPVKKSPKSGYRGVYFSSKKGTWYSKIVSHRKVIYLGSFKTPESAACAYNEALKKYNLNRKPNILPPDIKIEGILLSSRNTSGYRGVYYHKNKRKWCACINVDQKQLILGYFETKELAAHAYNEAALKYRGPDARINVIEPTELQEGT